MTDTKHNARRDFALDLHRLHPKRLHFQSVHLFAHLHSISFIFHPAYQSAPSLPTMIPSAAVYLGLLALLPNFGLAAPTGHAPSIEIAEPMCYDSNVSW
jgi:hypothetical protein